MSESEGQRNDSPLLSERGVTTISDTVVSQVAGMAAQEVEGVHMGGGASRSAGGVLESLTGSDSKTSGVSVEVGRTEAAIDLKMGIEYNRNILETVEEVRRRITERVQETTGLRIKELNATITDITFPEQETRRRLRPATPMADREDDSEQTTTAATETQEAPESETAEASESEATQAETEQVETTEVEPTSRTHTESSSGPVPEEEVTVEDRPLEEGETAEVRVQDETTEVRVDEQPTTETTEPDAEPVTESETRAESETSEELEASTETETAESEATESETTDPESSETETPEERIRRRAEERARRRRERSQDDS